MIVKTPIIPERVRKVPKSFSWIDHRLVRDGYIERCSHGAGFLYLFLVCVGDDKGLSYYGDQALMKKLSMDKAAFENARLDLVRMGLLAWQAPLYQVLNFESSEKIRGNRQSMLLGDILKAAMEVAHD